MTFHRRVAVKRESRRWEPSTCEAHGIPRKMYCYDCKQLACADCLLEGHTQHQYDYMRKVLPKYRQALEDKKALLMEACHDYARANASIQTRREAILERTTRVCRTVNDAFDGIHRLLEEKRAELLRKAAEITELKLSSLGDQERHIAHSLSNLNEFVAEVEALTLDPGREEEMVCSFQKVSEEVRQQKVTLQNMCLEPLEIPDLEADVVFVQQIREVCQSYPPQVFASTMCRAGTNLTEVGSVESLLLRPTADNPSINVTLRSLDGQCTVSANVVRKANKLHEALYTPAVRGRHTLSVVIDGQRVRSSPQPVFVNLPPTLINRPVKILANFNTPTGLAFNSEGDMVVTECEANQVSIRDRQGKKLFDLRGHTFERPFGVALDREDNIYVSEEAANRISKFTRSGAFVKSIGSRGSGYGQFQSPRGLRIVNGNLYVCDRENDRVQVFNTELHFLDCIVGKENSFKWATDIVASHDGLLYIAGTDISDVHVINLSDYSTATSVHHITLLCPTGVSFDHTYRYLYVVDFNYHSVFVFTRDGSFVSKFGGEGREEGQLMFPRGIAIDQDGYIYVCDTQNNRIQIF